MPMVGWVEVVAVVVVPPAVVVLAEVVETWNPPNCWVVRVPVVCAGSGSEKVDSQLLDGGAVDLGKLHFEQHLLRPHRAEGQNVHHIFGVGEGDITRPLEDVFGRDMAGEDDGRSGGRDADLLIREDALLFFGASADVDIDAQVETLGAFQFVPDQQRYLARSAPMD